jgi:ribosomal protein S18 acetylase RimI-like enzyme
LQVTDSIRQATQDDAPELARVAAVTFPLACPPHTTEEAIRQFIAANLTEERFGQYLADPDRELLLAEVGGEAAGYAMVVHRDPTDPDVSAAVGPRPTSELSKLYVLPDRHGSGLAGNLLEDAVTLAVEHGALTMWLGVNQENARANRFYEKHGFRTVGMKRFLVGDRYEDDFVKLRELAD